jgi:hypothetical protein
MLAQARCLLWLCLLWLCLLWLCLLWLCLLWLCLLWLCLLWVCSLWRYLLCLGAVARHAHADRRALVGARRRHLLLQCARRSVRHEGLRPLCAHIARPSHTPHPALRLAGIAPVSARQPPLTRYTPYHATPLTIPRTLILPHTLTILRQVCVWSVAGNGVPMVA